MIPRHHYLDPVRVQHDLDTSAARDPFGDRLHLFFGLLWCCFTAAPTSLVEIASIPLIVFFLIRTPNIWRTWGTFAVQPLSILFLIWIGWQSLTLFWSPDPRQGLLEVGANRWVWVALILWPVMGFRPWLIAAITVGFLLGNLAQLGHELGLRFNLPSLVWPRLPDRNSGWWDPVVGGSLLVGALGLHLPAALMGRGRMRMIAAAAALITLLGIFATGTRGAWLAAAALCLGGVCTAIARIRPRRRMLAAIVAALLVSGLAGAAVWLASGDGVKRRLEQASTEITRALKHQDYDSDTGARLRMARLAIQAVREHPVRGLGAGGFRPFMAEQLKSEPSSARIHAHAHNAFLHIAATTGLPGLLLAAAIMFTAIRGGLAGLGREGLGTYAAGPAFALLGLLLVSPFDPVHLNAQTGAFLATLFALCLESRPAPKPLPWGRRTGPAG